MASGVRWFGAEGRTDLEHPVQAGGHEHLLVQLRGLSEIGLLSEVVHLEQGGAALGAGGYQLGSEHLNEAVVRQVLVDKPHGQ